MRELIPPRESQGNSGDALPQHCALGDVALDLASQGRLALSVLFWLLALMCELVPLSESQEQLRGRCATAVQSCCNMGDIAIDLV